MEEIIVLSEKERNWAMFCHLSSFASVVVPFGGIIGPLICWSSKRYESKFVDQIGKASLISSLSMLLYTLVCIPLVFIVIGVFFLGALLILGLVCDYYCRYQRPAGESHTGIRSLYHSYNN
ncbi:MAG: DUF4870 domain-containing protein [Bacteroidales bacterium]